MKLPLITGAYEARSLIASAQRCVNLYPEANPTDSEFPTTHYPTPGLIRRATAPLRGFRGLYTATTGDLYAAVATAIYRITDDWTFVPIGTIAAGTGPVSMQDNTIDLTIVDGTKAGYTVDLKTYDFARITSDAFYGSPRVSVLDDFLIFNQPDTRQFYISGALAVTFDSLDIAAKNGAPDKLISHAVVDRMLWLFGQSTTEVWYNTGASDFTFERYPGVFIPHGCAAAASVATVDTAVYWLADGKDGDGMVFRSNQLSGLRISTHALDKEIRSYPRIDDAIGYCHQTEGHTFYVLTFPTADKTWSFDLATSQWHERMWLDDTGAERRHRGNCFAFWNRMQLVGDWETGDLYEMTPDAFDDAGNSMLHIRSWPALSNEKKRIYLERFSLDMEVGEAPVTAADDPQVRLRWSDNRGRTWGNKISRSLGARGEFDRLVQFNRCGRSRERIFEVSWSANVSTALNGAYVDPQAGA
ncbi:hypothetical protein [Paraburkholderia caribensis]|uniref:hypothetical protein n=1 Tax=Paraburkholderia caribensis TaxID=75105 RepID=UPI001CAD9B09|nr:hypothetical protein [Paraburkholderia caribensis]CAG9255991.1 conserved hypothetical protein [Paraburkholderia caribensis]